MNREFQEVFPGVQVESGLEELLQGVEVQRVSLSKKKDLLRVYMRSPQWIHKRYTLLCLCNSSALLHCYLSFSIGHFSMVFSSYIP